MAREIRTGFVAAYLLNELAPEARRRLETASWRPRRAECGLVLEPIARAVTPG